MDIKIINPYQNNGDRIVEFDGFSSIYFKGEEAKNLLEELDNELNYGETIEELQSKIFELEDEISMLQRELGLR